MSEKIRAAIVGGSEDGKTFLASGFSRGLWKARRWRSLVFDPYKGETAYGPQALVFGPTSAEQGNPDLYASAVTREFERFKRTVSSVKLEQKFCAIWDEASSTGGRNRDNTGLVTAIRHNCPGFLVLCHSYATLLPAMRGSLTDVILAARDPDDAAEWAKVMVDPSIIEAAQSLKQYEFLHKRKHQPARILRYSKAEILAGVVP